MNEPRSETTHAPTSESTAVSRDRPLTGGARIAFGVLLWGLLIACGAFTYWAQQIKPALGAAAITNVYWKQTYQAPLPYDGLVFDPDGAYAVKFAQELAEPGPPRFRVRHTEVDGLPGGREMRWGMLNIWWLYALGLGASLFSGAPATLGVLQAAPWSGPLLLLLGLAGWSLALLRAGRGWGAGAVLLTSTLICASTTYRDFGFGFPDHHGWHQWAALGLVLGLAVRWVPRDTDRMQTADAATDWRVLGGWGHVSAFCGAVILWLGASQAVIIYGTVCVCVGGCLLAARWLKLEERVDLEAPLPPEFWRWWGLAGAAWGLVFYLVENAPNHFAMRLEINHPLYLAAWAAAGEFLCRWARLCSTAPREPALAKRDWAVAAACLIPMLLPAPVLLLAPPEWLLIKHPAIANSMAIISEGEPGINGWKEVLYLPAGYWALPAVWVAAMVVLIQRRISTRSWLALGTVAGASLLLIAASVAQARWLGQATAVTAALAACVGAVLPVTLRWSRRGWLGLILGAQFCAFFLRLAVSVLSGASDLMAYNVNRLVARNELGDFLRREEKVLGRVPRVLITPLSPVTNNLFLYGPARPLASFYWENAEGVAAAFNLLSLDDEAAALAEIQRLGVTHVIVTSRPEDMTAVFMIRNAAPEPNPRSLVMRLAHPKKPSPPAWLEPVSEMKTEALSPDELTIYRFVPDHDVPAP